MGVRPQHVSRQQSCTIHYMHCITTRRRCMHQPRPADMIQLECSLHAAWQLGCVGKLALGHHASQAHARRACVPAQPMMRNTLPKSVDNPPAFNTQHETVFMVVKQLVLSKLCEMRVLALGVCPCVGMHARIRQQAGQRRATGTAEPAKCSTGTSSPPHCHHATCRHTPCHLYHHLSAVTQYRIAAHKHFSSLEN